ncbi:hypothetical protein [Thalassobacillus pellis]|uniref:hypothetical protein n=1 Tax=Thalassobacillus pellis TaxID=748008 RepID=UPI001961DC88|nr:hypothetical protein [Thalassobacillus pellis]MBM7553586.1 LytS/YehU family sensor histidine kinase [Thalassobacillus pellis]
MKRSLSAGFTVGILSGIAALITEFVIGWMTGLWFEELTIISIILSSIITNLAGAMIFKQLDQKTSKATFFYALVVGAVTLILTFNTMANPPQEQFGTVSHPIHIVVALVSIWLIPKWTKKYNSDLQDNPTAKAN